jgi:hypothetical protein
MKLAHQVLDLCEDRLLGSASSESEILKLIVRFYGGSGHFELKAINDKEFDVHNSKGKIEGGIVRKKGSRYRFEMLSSDEEAPKKPMNYFVSALVYFNDDSVISKKPSKQKIKAVDAKDAEKQYRALIDKNWNTGTNKVKKIDIISITKGAGKDNQHQRDPNDKDHPLTRRG